MALVSLQVTSYENQITGVRAGADVEQAQDKPIPRIEIIYSFKPIRPHIRY